MSFDPTRVKAVCFDVDGTLSDTDDNWVAQIEQRLHFLKSVLPGNDLHTLARWLVMSSETPMNAVYHWLDAWSLDDNIARIYERMIRQRKHVTQSFWLMAGANETLAELSARFPLSVVSARDEYSTQGFIDQFSLGSYFHFTVTSQTCEHTKPYPQPILWVAERMQVPPRNLPHGG